MKSNRILLLLSLIGLLLAISSQSNYVLATEEHLASNFTPEQQEIIDSQAEKFTFQTEVNKLMNIIINSLYSKKEIFLRELISNASDALDKIRFLALTNPALLGDGDAAKLEIKVQADKKAKTLTILDKGIGMTKEDLIKNLGTIAQSGTKEFIQKMSEQSADNSNLIGQFGVGFYSLFLVADNVVVTSKHNDDDQYIWSSDSNSVFTIAKDPQGNTLGRGTKITLHIKDDSLEFLEDATIKELVKKYSQFINFPIYLYTTTYVQPEEEETATPEPADETDVKVDEEEEETEETEKPAPEPIEQHEWVELNDIKPLWTKSSKDISKEEYIAFYKSISKTNDEPISYSHFSASGDTDFKAIIYIPKEPPTNMFDLDNAVSNIKLFVRRVFITDNLKDLLPNWLRFLVGVIDSDDLPINVSREMLQQHKTLDIIKSKITRKFVSMVQELYDAEDKTEFYDFSKKYGTNLKLGALDDKSNKARLIKLLVFHSSKEEHTTFEEYVARMKEGQDQIFFIAGKSIDSLAASPLVEQALKRDYEVLYMVDPIDEYLVSQNQKYDKYKLTNLAREGVKFEEEKDEEKEASKQIAEEYKPLTKFLKKILGDKVEKVTISKILADSPVALLTNQYGVTANMERIMKAQSVNNNMDTYAQAFNKKILEINPEHELVKRLLSRINEHGDSDEIAKVSAHVLYETASLSSGFQMENPKNFANWIYKMMSLSGEKLTEATYETEKGPHSNFPMADDDEQPSVTSEVPPTVHDEL